MYKYELGGDIFMENKLNCDDEALLENDII